MDISLPEDNTGKCYLPTGVDGAGIATKKFLDSNGAISKLDQKERQKLQDSRVIMKAYLISKLVAARYTFEDGHMEFNERAESNHIDMMEYKGTFQYLFQPFSTFFDFNSKSVRVNHILEQILEQNIWDSADFLYRELL